jgi:hypothetical protein
MYGGKGAGPVVGGAILLPNTGGNTILTIVAYTGMVVGGTIVLSSLVRMVAKKVSALRYTAWCTALFYVGTRHSL